MAQSGLVMLRRRPEFLRIRNGLRWSTGAFVVEAKSRDGWRSPMPIAAELARFGLTVTKQLGSAVHRNRIRRRLRSALRLTVAMHAKPGFDYVVIARADAETLPFERLVTEMAAALEGVHTRKSQFRSGNTKRQPGKSPRT